MIYFINSWKQKNIRIQTHFAKKTEQLQSFITCRFIFWQKFLNKFPLFINFRSLQILFYPNISFSLQFVKVNKSFKRCSVFFLPYCSIFMFELLMKTLLRQFEFLPLKIYTEQCHVLTNDRKCFFPFFSKNDVFFIVCYKSKRNDL